jgi:phage shock protein PspC (stress-responsive transcriptional regulator)
LADPCRDCRRELAERLIGDCGSRGQASGSIVVYSSFEKIVIGGLAELFPDLEKDLIRLLIGWLIFVICLENIITILILTVVIVLTHNPQGRFLEKATTVHSNLLLITALVDKYQDISRL